MEDGNYEAKKALEIAGLEKTIQMQKDVSCEVVARDVTYVIATSSSFWLLTVSAACIFCSPVTDDDDDDNDDSDGDDVI